MTRARSRKMVPRWEGLIPDRSCAPPGTEDFGQHRHAHGDAVSDLIADHGLRAVGHLGGDLDAAVHRLRMHHDGIGAGQCEALGGEAPGGEVLLAVGHVGIAEALLLDAQHHDHVGALQAPGDRLDARATLELVRRGHECGGADDAQIRHAEGAQRMPRRARHARMADVADDRDREAGKALLALIDGERIEQSLRRVRDVRLARRQHADVRGDVPGHELRHPRLGVADDERIDVQRLQRIDGVEHALALDARGELYLEVDDLGAEALGGELEADAGAGRGLGEEIGDREPGERNAARRLLAERADEGLRTVEQPLDLRPRQRLERQQVAERPVGPQLFSHRFPSPANQRPRITAAAALSTSARLTRRRRSPLARRALRWALASREEKRSSTRWTGSAKRRSSSAAKRRAAPVSAPSLPSALYGAPTTSCAGASARTSRPIASQSGPDLPARIAARGAALLVRVSPEAMPMRLSPKSKARTV